MKAYFYCLLLNLLSLSAIADSLQRVELNYRQPATLKATLSELFKDDLSIVIDRNALLLRGSTADLKGVVAMIKRLDQPAIQFSVALYRGVDPENKTLPRQNQKVITTHRHENNQVEYMRVEEGANIIIRDRQQLASSGLNVHIEQRSFEGKQRQQGEKKVVSQLSDKQYVTFYTERMIELGLINNKKSIRVNYSIPVSNRALSNDKAQGLNTLLSQVMSTTVIDLDQWVPLFYQQAQANQIRDDKKSKVSTTKNAFDSQQSIWIKVSLL